MASIIRIKRSDVAGNPSTLAAGELAYSGLTDNGSNGGDRLYIGMGSETNGDAVNHFVVGGKYFTDMLDHTKGTLTANSAIIVDDNSKIDIVNVDNLTLDGNTISSTDTDGNIVLDPNGDGAVSVTSPVAITSGSESINVFQVVDSVGSGLLEVKQNGDLDIGGVLTVNGVESDFTGTVNVEQLNVNNIRIDDNTISSTNTDGNIVLDPNGTGVVDVSNARITNLAEPVNDADAATKNYVDAARSGLDVKQSVKAATVGNIDLASPPGTIDNITINEGDRVLVKEQNSALENGIYVLTSGSLVRASDFDENFEVSGGAFTFVEQGDVNSDTGFVVTSDGQLQVGTDPITWTLFSASGTLIAGEGLSKDGYTLRVNVDTNGGIEIASDNLKLKDSVAGAGLTITNGVLDVVGTTDRITVNANSIDIASTYAGQTSIDTLGTITTGTWEADVIQDAYIAQDLTIVGGTINATPIGQSTAAAGSFTSLTASGQVDFTNTDDVVVATGGVTAAVELSGGLAIAKTTFVGGDLIGSGELTSSIDGFTIDGGTY